MNHVSYYCGIRVVNKPFKFDDIIPTLRMIDKVL